MVKEHVDDTFMVYARREGHQEVGGASEVWRVIRRCVCVCVGGGHQKRVVHT